MLVFASSVKALYAVYEDTYLYDIQQVAEIGVKHLPEFLDALGTLLGKALHGRRETADVNKEECGFHCLSGVARFDGFPQPPLLHEVLHDSLG